MLADVHVFTCSKVPRFPREGHIRSPEATSGLEQKHHMKAYVPYE